MMDILVRLASGALVNVEIQRVGYLFPGARCTCYSTTCSCGSIPRCGRRNAGPENGFRITISSGSIPLC